jgi:hypothetical protein
MSNAVIYRTVHMGKNSIKPASEMRSIAVDFALTIAATTLMHG